MHSSFPCCFWAWSFIIFWTSALSLDFFFQYCTDLFQKTCHFNCSLPPWLVPSLHLLSPLLSRQFKLKGTPVSHVTCSLAALLVFNYISGVSFILLRHTAEISKERIHLEFHQSEKFSGLSASESCPYIQFSMTQVSTYVRSLKMRNQLFKNSLTMISIISDCWK